MYPKEKIDKIYLPKSEKNTLLKVVDSIVKSEINPIGITVIGSAIKPNKCCSGKSDIDICIHLDKKYQEEIDELITTIENELSNISSIFLVKPRFIKDFKDARIETFIIINNITFDLTFSFDYQYVGTSPYEVVRDNFEVHIGSIYVYGVNIYGKRPNEDKYLPYYNENLRKKRLHSLIEYIYSKIDKISNIRVNQARYDELTVMYKTRKVLLQYVFIQKRKYPWSLEKDIEMQLREILKVNDKELKRLLIFPISFTIYEFMEFVRKKIGDGIAHKDY